MILTIDAAQPDPDATEARSRVFRILGDDFAPPNLASAIDGLASRSIYPQAADFLAGIVAGKGAPGRNLLVAHLLELGVSQDTRARRVAADIGLIARSVDAHSFAFGFADLCEATAVAPLAWLALASLGYARGEDGRPCQYSFGDPWPPTRRERAGLALHFLCARATQLRRGAP